MKMTKAELDALDKAATQGVWIRHNNPKKWVSTLSPVTDEEWRANCDNDGNFVCALVNAYRTGQLVPREAVDLVGGNTLPSEYVRWLSSIEVDVRVHDLTADEVARLIAALNEGVDHEN